MRNEFLSEILKLERSVERLFDYVREFPPYKLALKMLWCFQTRPHKGRGRSPDIADMFLAGSFSCIPT